MSPSLDKAMILAAGLGRRLRPLTVYFAKPSLPLMGRPLIEYILRLLARKGVREAVVNLHHGSSAIERSLDRVSGLLEVRRSLEPELLGTAGGLVKAGHYFRAGTFLLSNGDTLMDFDLEELAERHRASKAKATLLLRPKPSGSDYATLELDRGGRIRALGRRGRSSGLMFAGVWVLEPSVLHYLSGAPVGLEKELLPRLIEEGSASGCVQDRAWITIDTPRRYWEACLTMARMRLFEEDWEVKPRRIPGDGSAEALVLAGEGTEIESGARFRGRVVLGSGCRVHRGATLDNTICWDRVEVAPGVVLKNAVVSEGVRFRPGIELLDKVVMKLQEDHSAVRQREIQNDLVVADLKTDRSPGL